MVCATPEGHIDIYGPLPQAVSKHEVHVDVYDLKLALEAGWISKAHATARSQVDVRSVSHHRRPY